jgi:dsRNA-specific ribonuclease
MSANRREEIKKLRELAWVGDAVLGLYARNWILERHGRIDSELLERMTSNRFLGAVGVPTEVEARIGQIYKAEGLEKAFGHIECLLMPLFQKQWDNFMKTRRGSKEHSLQMR